MSPPLATCDLVQRATANLHALSAKDALRVWRALGGYVAAQLAQRRGVRVDGWGVFALGAAREPVFLHSAAFLRANRVRERRGAAIGDAGVSIAPVNMAAVAQHFLPGGGCSKELVAAVVAAVLALAGSLAKQGRALRLSWLPMGEWHCDDGAAGFAFLVAFQTQMKLLGSAHGAAKVGQGVAAAAKTPDSREPPPVAATRDAAPASRALSAAALRAHAVSASSPTVAHSTASGGRAATLVKSCSSSGAVSQRPGTAATRSVRSSTPSSAEAAQTASAEKQSSSARRSLRATPEARARSKASVPSASASASSKAPSVRSQSRRELSPAQPRKAWAELRPRRPQDVAAVARVKSKLLARCGDNGLNALRQVLQAMDASGDGALAPNELKFGLRDLGVELSVGDLAQVVEALDRDRNGSVDLHELLHALRGEPLAGTRLALVRRAFALMDVDDKNAVSVDDMRDNFDVSSFPAVRAKRTSKQQALAEFLRHWQEVSDGSGGAGVRFDAFLDYYQNVSACVAEDSDFELLMRQTWHVSPPEQRGGGDDEGDAAEGDAALEQDTQQPSGWTNAPQRPDTGDQRRSGGARDDESATRVAGREASLRPEAAQLEEDWWHLRRLLVPAAGAYPTSKVPTVDDVSRRLGANRVWGDGNELLHAKVFARSLALLDRQLSAKEALLLAQRVASTVSSAGAADSIALAELHRWLLLRPPLEVPATAVNGGSTSSSSVQPTNVVTRVRSRLLQRIARSTSDTAAATAADAPNVAHVGLNGLQRCLKLIDTNGDKRVTKDELQSGLRKFGVDVTFHELDYLFTHFDADRSGCISVDEFLVGMRGEMSARRTRFVAMAFDLLDADRDGAVTLDELAAAYDASQHPDVVSGRMTAEDALRAFAAQWESTKERDGVITRREFETYYANLSASIDSDDYFELMMRNAWHLAGGDGACANSTNRRVLVTRDDETQSVEEIEGDLGIRTRDHDMMRALLAKQRVAVAVDTYGACGELQAPAKGGGGGGADRQPASSIKHRVAREPPPGRAFHRRRVLEMEEEDATSASGVGVLPGKRTRLRTSSGVKQRAGGDDSAAPPAATYKQRLEAERGARQRAAQLIQRHFRGFRARKFVECAKRRLAAEQQRVQRAHAEQASGRKKVLRAALRSHHGF